MNDTVEKGVSSLAVVEKKPPTQRPGGCVGIFFQLFDWNRRLAKKKLFSKKLLPPVRFKQASKKFGGDEKQPKLRLIADENSGGFPTTSTKNNNGGSNAIDKEQRQEKRVPTLVARLMGLESMPALQREKSKKVQAAGSVCKAEKCVDNREEMNVEKGGGIKHELRPQKLQKTTSVCERQPGEKLAFKNVLPKSRKNPTKLPSPVKSPRNLSKKRSSKLIGAAARILEPGLQTSRSKYALTYSNTLQHPPQETDDMDGRIHLLSTQMENSDGFGSVAVKGESSCRNCGYSVDNSNIKPCISAQPLVFASPFSNCVGSSCCERSKPGYTAIHQELEDLHQDYSAVPGPSIGNTRSHVKFTSYKNPYTGQIQQHLGSQECKPPKGVPISPSSNYKPQMRNQMLWARETVPSRPNLNSVMNNKVSTTVINGTKDSVSASLSGSTRSRVPTRIDNSKFELEKRLTNDSVVPVRKRRPAAISRQGENSGFTMSEKQLGYDAHSNNHQQGRVVLLRHQGRAFNSGQGNNNAAPFKFNLQKSGIYEVAERRARSGLCSDDSLQKSVLGENSRKLKFEKPSPISGDALGALLEQKLNELNCQGEDIGNAPKKTTATILQELITALTSEVPLQQDSLPAISDQTNGWFNGSHLSNSTSFNHSQANVMHMKPYVDQPFDSEHLSPGSVLETQFSTESCPCSSVDDSLGYKMPNESQDCSYYEPQSLNPDYELLDPAASLKTAEGNKKLVIEILNSVSETLRCSNLAFGLKGKKLEQANEVLLNAELASHNATLSGSVVGKGSPIKHLLLYDMETLARLLWMDFGCSLGIEDGKEVNQLRSFALDSTMEYLGLKFEGYPNCGSKVTRKLPLRMNSNMLILEIVEVVRRWEELSRYGLDELIEREMSLSLGEWTVCETEAFETGMEISRHLFQILVDEIVIDLWKF
ncbi:hypothetical protein ACS0TY_008563 [Phlomoides rotata]